MELWLQKIISALPEGNVYLLLLYIFAFAEALPIFGLIVPGSTLAVFSGFLVIQGKSTLFLLILIHIAGALAGDLLSFWLGYYYGSKWLRLRSFQKHRQLVKRSEEFFLLHGGKSIFFARFLGPIRGITPFIAGLSGMPGRIFSGYAIISAILWGISYPGLGYLGGRSWQQAQSLSSRFGLLIIIALAGTVLHHWIRKNIKRT